MNSPNPDRKQAHNFLSSFSKIFFFSNYWNFSSPFNIRLLLVILMVVVAFFAIGLRIVYLTFVDKGESFSTHYQQRGMITDIENKPLAFSEERYNLYYNPRKGALDNKQASKIAENIGEKVNADQIISKIGKERTFLLSRYASKETMDSILQLDLPGLLIEKTMFRIYPYNNFLSQTLGFVGHEGNGFYGLEYKYNKFLNYDLALGYEKSLVLNIKLDFQKKIENLIQKSVRVNSADYGSIIVQEVNSGRILGIANYPDFNLNKFRNYPNQAFINRSTSFLLEPGSIFKIFFIAYLIEKFNPKLDEKKYYCEGFYELANGEIIKCHGVHGKISIEDIIKYSCNSGIIQATEKLTPKEMYNFIKRLRIGESHGIDLPNESRGIILKLKDWGIRTKATIPLGHGLALTPLHLINVFSALIGKGYLYQPKIARYLEKYQNRDLINRQELKPEIINKIISKDISQKIVDLLYFGTIKGSTGYTSRSTGFEQVFGKTATSQLANIDQGGYYTNRYHSMFVGGYPIDNPQYSILVVVSRPKREYYGGKVAAPIYAQVVETLNKHYNLTGERNIEKLQNLLIEESPNDEYIEELLSNQLPNFIGLSIRKAVTLIEDFKQIQKQKNIKINYKIKGKGFVKKQSPPPGDEVKKNMTITLFFE